MSWATKLFVPNLLPLIAILFLIETNGHATATFLITPRDRDGKAGAHRPVIITRSASTASNLYLGTNTLPESSTFPATDIPDSTPDTPLEADLRLQLDGPSQIPEPGPVTYTLTMTNLGPDPASEVQLSVQVSTSLEFFQNARVIVDEGEEQPCVTLLDFCGADCDETKNKPLAVGCTIGTLAFGEVRHAIVNVKLPAAGPQLNISNLVTTTSDPDLNNNTSLLETVVGNPNKENENSEGGGDDGGCFIATAAYGSALAPEVEILRTFRDTYLLPSTLGQLLVQTYYQTSPPLAAFIRHHSFLKAFIRGVLWPIVWWVQLTLQVPYWGVAILVLTLLLSVSALYGMLQLWAHATVQTPNRKDGV